MADRSLGAQAKTLMVQLVDVRETVRELKRLGREAEGDLASHLEITILEAEVGLDELARACVEINRTADAM